MAKLTLKQRIGIDIGRRVSVEDGIEWAAQNDVQIIDVQTDIHPNALESFDAKRIKGVRSAKEKHGLRLGLHTLSGVNVAEISPFCRDAVDAYMKAYIDLAPQIGAEWIVVHGGYHFTACRTIRMQASIERLKRISAYAEKKGVNVCLEMLNTRDDSDPNKGHPGYQGDHIDYCLDIVKKVGSPNMKLLFDIYHVQIMDGDVIRRIHECGEHIGHVHTAGNPGRGELDNDQEINYPPIMKALLDIGYKGFVGQEFIPTRDPLQGLTEAVELCDV